MAKTTWTLELKSASAVRDARALRRELQSLQGALEGVDLAARRASGSVGAVASAQSAARRVRSERAVAREVRGTYEAHRRGSGRIAQDERTQQRVRGAVDRAQRANAAQESREAQRREARDARSARAAAQRQSRADRAWRAEMRRAGAIANLNSRTEARSERAQMRAFRDDRASRRSGWGYALGAAGLVGAGALGIAGATLGAASAFADMALSASRLALSLGESVLQMIAFREASLATLRMMNGGDGRVAAEQYQFARQFARETPLDTQQVLELQQQVSTAGFRGQQNRDVVLAGADVGAANPNDSTASSRYVRAVSQIRNAGRLRAQEMNQLGEVGIGRRELLLSLGRQTRVQRGTGESEDAYVARLQQMQDSGRFTGDQGVAAAQDVVRRQFSGGGALGSGARSQGDTLLGTLSNLRGAVFDLFTGINGIEQLPGVRALKATLNGIANTIAGTTATGKRLQAIVSTVVNDVGMLVGTSGLADFDATLNGVLDAGKDFVPIVREIVTAFGGAAMAQARQEFGGLGASFKDTFGNPVMVSTARALGRALVSLFGMGSRLTVGLAAIGTYATIGLDAVLRLARVLDPSRLLGYAQGFATMMQGFLAPVSTMDMIRARMGGVGDQAVLGIRMGIQRSMPGLQADVAAMAQSIPETAQSNLAIKSPSRVMADEVGRYIPEGIAQGIDRGRGALDAAMGDLVPVPGVPGAGGLGGFGGVTIGSLVIQVEPGADAEETGRNAARGALDELMRLFETPALAGA